MIKSLKNHKIVYMVLAFVVALGAALWVTAETENPGKINLTKTATKVYEDSSEDDYSEDNLEKGRYAKVTLDVNANSYNLDATTKLDIILVIDNSTSMDDTDANTAGTQSRREAAKSAATDFVNSLINENKDNVKIGVVVFGTDIQKSQKLSSTKTTVNNFINGINSVYNEGTNIQAGIAKANELLTTSNGARTDAKKVVVILTDGIPTFFNHTYSSYWSGTQTETCGNGSDDSYANSGLFSNCPHKRPSEAAKEELDSLKSTYPKSDVYTIAFGNANDENTRTQVSEKLAYINPAESNTNHVYANYQALTGEELKEKFQGISDSLIELIGKNSTVTDVIPADFTLTDSSKAALEEQGVVVTANEDGTTTLTWTIGNINAGTDYNLSYEVKAKDDYHGSMYTNDNATLTTTVNDDNPYYKDETNKTLTLDFEKPTVEIPAITSDDHYNDNHSYQGYAEATISGTSILTNDKLANIMTDGTNVKVEDKIVINENDNTRKVANTTNKYEIYKNNVKQGTLTVNEDGTFTFVSEENIKGEVEFTYHIESTINPNHETNKVISNDSKVTLNILERSKVNTTGELTVTKTWSDGENQDGIRPGSVEVVLKANNAVKEKATLDAKSKWTHTFTGLYQYEVGKEGLEEGKITYTVEETSVPTGYTVSVTGDVAKGFTVTNSHTPELINDNSGKLTVTKAWSDGENQDGIRPESVSVTLTADGKDKETVELNVGNKWTYTFKDLPKKANGKDIEYKVVENSVPTGYTVSVTGDVAKGFTITNSHTPELINDNSGKLTVTKAWVDAEDKFKKRPGSVVLTLLDVITVNDEEDVKEVGDATLTSTDGWTYIFENLPKYRNGKEINYKLIEKNVNENYTFSYNKNTDENGIVSLIGVNTIKELKRDIPVTKVWDDAGDQDGLRPNEKNEKNKDITVTLTGIVDGEELDPIPPITITGNDTDEKWYGVFEDVPTFKDGKLISYSISEDKVEGYSTEITGSTSGYTITNTHIPDTTTVKGYKKWDDKDNQDGKRKPITVNLLADEEVIKSVELDGTKVDDEGNWIFEFTDLPTYKEHGTEIIYAVEEAEDEDISKYYETDVEYNDELEVNIITNSHTPMTISYELTKNWDDLDDQDGIRPESITVTLTGTVEELNYSIEPITIEVTAAKGWTYTFDKLDKYYKGYLIKYTIEETAVPGYKTEDIVQINNVEDEFEFSTTIDNTHVPETIDIPVTKTWDDVDNVEGLRPEKIAVDLYANGEYKETFYITSADDWKVILSGLPKFYDHGKLVEYTLVEHTVEGYTTIIDGFNILNRHELGKGTGMDDVEVLPPHTGIMEVSSNNNNILEFILSLIMIIPLTLKLTKIEER